MRLLLLCGFLWAWICAGMVADDVPGKIDVEASQRACGLDKCIFSENGFQLQVHSCEATTTPLSVANGIFIHLFSEIDNQFRQNIAAQLGELSVSEELPFKNPKRSIFAVWKIRSSNFDAQVSEDAAQNAARLTMTFIRQRTDLPLKGSQPAPNCDFEVFTFSSTNPLVPPTKVAAGSMRWDSIRKLSPINLQHATLPPVLVQRDALSDQTDTAQRDVKSLQRRETKGTLHVYRTEDFSNGHSASNRDFYHFRFLQLSKYHINLNVQETGFIRNLADDITNKQGLSDAPPNGMYRFFDDSLDLSINEIDTTPSRLSWHCLFYLSPAITAYIRTFHDGRVQPAGLVISHWQEDTGQSHDIARGQLVRAYMTRADAFPQSDSDHGPEPGPDSPRNSRPAMPGQLRADAPPFIPGEPIGRVDAITPGETLSGGFRKLKARDVVSSQYTEAVPFQLTCKDFKVILFDDFPPSFESGSVSRFLEQVENDLKQYKAGATLENNVYSFTVQDLQLILAEPNKHVPHYQVGIEGIEMVKEALGVYSNQQSRLHKPIRTLKIRLFPLQSWETPGTFLEGFFGRLLEH